MLPPALALPLNPGEHSLWRALCVFERMGIVTYRKLPSEVDGVMRLSRRGPQRARPPRERGVRMRGKRAYLGRAVLCGECDARAALADSPAIPASSRWQLGR